MLSTGLKKPDVTIRNTMLPNNPRNACCCVLQVADMVKPIPAMAKTNTSMLSSSINRQPLNGMPKANIAKIITIAPANIPPNTAGNIFPKIISRVLTGDTTSWSKVPNSRSLAIESALMLKAGIKARVATSAGTMYHLKIRFGLNQCLTIALGDDSVSSLSSLLSSPAMVWM